MKKAPAGSWVPAIAAARRRTSLSSAAGAPSGPSAGLLALQRPAGNQAVNRLLESHDEGYGTNPTGLASRARAANGSETGHPLDPGVRSELEERFGMELDGVRIHSGREAAAAVHDLGARAFTECADIHFGARQYEPTTLAGVRLLAHEIAHVIQQRRGAASERLPDQTSEEGAEQAAASFATGAAPVAVRGEFGRGIARQAAPAAPARYPAGTGAWQGIELYPLAREELSVRETFVFPRGHIFAGVYRIVPQLRDRADPHVLFDIAYNTHAGRIEFAIGPNDLDAFIAHTTAFIIAAGNFFGFSQEPPPYVVQSAQVGRRALRGDLRGALRALGRSWVETLRDPGWLAGAAAATAGGILARGGAGAEATAAAASARGESAVAAASGGAVAPETEAAQAASGAAARQVPAATSGAAVEVEATAARPGPAPRAPEAPAAAPTQTAAASAPAARAASAEAEAVAAPPGSPEPPAAAPGPRARLPGARSTRHLPRHFELPSQGRSGFPETSQQLGTPQQRAQGLVRARGERVAPGEVGTRASEVPGGRTGLREHWEQHAPEFPEYRNARQYGRGAIDFCRDPATRRFYYRFGGRPTIGSYNAETGTFASTSVDGRVIYTYFRPGPEGVERVLRSARFPEAAAGAERAFPPGVQPHNSVPFRQGE